MAKNNPNPGAKNRFPRISKFDETYSYIRSNAVPNKPYGDPWYNKLQLIVSIPCNLQVGDYVNINSSSGLYNGIHQIGYIYVGTSVVAVYFLDVDFVVGDTGTITKVADPNIIPIQIASNPVVIQTDPNPGVVSPTASEIAAKAAADAANKAAADAAAANAAAAAANAKAIADANAKAAADVAAKASADAAAKAAADASARAAADAIAKANADSNNSAAAAAAAKAIADAAAAKAAADATKLAYDNAILNLSATNKAAVVKDTSGVTEIVSTDILSNPYIKIGLIALAIIIVIKLIKK